MPGDLIKKRFAKEMVAVLCGGLSAEREVSFRSGENVYKALVDQGIPAVIIDAGRDLPAALVESGATLAYIALHGLYGEDGAVQGMLELMGIPYTGSGVQASAVCMDKVSTKRILQSEGIRTPEWWYFDRDSGVDIARVVKTGRLPVVIKPVAEGSSIGVVIARDEASLFRAAQECIEKNGSVLIEAFCTGREVTTGVLGTGQLARALPILELVPANEFYDYEAKYTPGMTEFILPARLEPGVYAAVQEEAVRVHRILGCRGVSRVDAIIDVDNRIWNIEVNTSPGMTNTSDLPAQAAEEGICFEELVLILLEDALFRAPERDKQE